MTIMHHKVYKECEKEMMDDTIVELCQNDGVEEERMSRCYICLENTHEKSPCECEINLHKECLENMLKNMTNVQCTVCKTDLIGVDHKIVADNDVEDILQQYMYLDQFLLSLLLLIYVLVMYILLGWAGKLVFMIWGYETDSFFSFWTADHLLAAVTICLIGFVTNHFIRCHNPAILLDGQLSNTVSDDDTSHMDDPPL